jgi:hypothetical protein
MVMGKGMVIIQEKTFLGPLEEYQKAVCTDDAFYPLVP